MLKTAECVSPMHPDKICDRISDAILDECLKQDHESRVAVEVMGGHGIITITGEVTTKAYFNAREIAQRIAGQQYGVQTNIVQQSPEIAQGVNTGGAGDQGIMVGYACNDNEDMIPQELYLARSLCKYIYDKFPQDGKTQITLEDGKIKTIVVSWCKLPNEQLKKFIINWLNNKYFKNEEKTGYINQMIKIHANPAGVWHTGGFEADTGLTGRKLAVDNYGPQIPIGGGCFSGKDASKVDRSAAYKARQIAVKLLKENKAYEVFVKIAYAIGVNDPVQLTATINGIEKNIIENNLIQCSPNEIIKDLELKKHQFEKTAEWGHFGNGFNWDLF